jgi:hypothetical protein
MTVTLADFGFAVPDTQIFTPNVLSADAQAS